DLPGQGGAEPDQPGKGVLLGLAAALQRRLRMFQRDIVGLHRANERSLAVEDHVAVADGPQKAGEATRPNQADQEVVLVLVEAADDGRELGAVRLQRSEEHTSELQ